MSQLVKYSLIALCLLQLNACVTAVVGGAAVGSQIAMDRRTSGIYIEDENIEIKSHSRLKKQLDEGSHVNVTSYNRVVLLAGEASSAAMKAKAETVIKTIPNIRAIYNEISVMDKTTISTRSKDALITSKVKGNFVTNYVSDKQFNPSHVKVVTERKVVYLMGLVTKSEAEAATNIARKTDGVEKVVKLFEYLP